MRSFVADATLSRRQERCPSCDSLAPSEYKFSVGDARVSRCSDCAMMFLRDAMPSTLYDDAHIAERVRTQIAHLAMVTGIPPSAMLTIIPDQAAMRIPGIQVLNASTFLERGEAQGTLEAAVCVDVLDTVDDPAHFLSNLHATLAPSAPVSMTVRSVDSTSARHARVSWRGFRSGAVRFYGIDSLQSTLIRHGFRDERIYVDGAIHANSIRLRGTAYLAAAVGIGGAAVRIGKRAGFIDESVTMIATRGERISRPLLSVIVPVYNECATVNELLSRLRAKSIEGIDIEIIVVESNSTDGSRDEVLKYDAHPHFKILLQDRPRGKGHAVRAALAIATGDIVLFQDADLEYEIDDYDDLLRPIVAYQKNFIIGSRHSQRAGWKIRKFNGAPFLSQIFNAGHMVFLTLLNTMYGQSMLDPFSMFKVFRRDCLAGLSFECNRFDFDFEIVIKLLRKGYQPLEIPVNYNARSIAEGKKVTLIRDPLTWLRALVKFRTSPLYDSKPSYGDASIG